LETETLLNPAITAKQTIKLKWGEGKRSGNPNPLWLRTRELHSNEVGCGKRPVALSLGVSGRFPVEGGLLSVECATLDRLKRTGDRTINRSEICAKWFLTLGQLFAERATIASRRPERF
jgi:hypothetical protein